MNYYHKYQILMIEFYVRFISLPKWGCKSLCNNCPQKSHTYGSSYEKCGSRCLCVLLCALYSVLYFNRKETLNASLSLG